VGAAYALLAPPWYRAQVSLLARDTKAGSGLPPQLAQMSGLARLAGINLNSSGKEESVAVRKSRGFVRQLIEENKLLTVILAHKWDPEKQAWHTSGRNKPDIRDGIKFFEDKIRTVAEDRKTGLLTVTIEWKDPVQAAEWANAMADQVNRVMQERALKEAEFNVSYLEAEMQKSNVVSLQQAISRLLESEMEKLMLARGGEEFAFRIVDRAEPPKLRSRPKRTVVVILAIVLGLMTGIATVFVKRFLHSLEDAAAARA
jgi:uncharacterized protein involved in exopolysaccharide biosynthesis